MLNQIYESSQQVYVYSRATEEMTPEGAKIQSELREEYLAKYCDEDC
jgi:hypothetical protein